MDIKETKSITITLTMEEAWLLERELGRMDFDCEQYRTTHDLYMLLPEKEDETCSGYSCSS